MKTLLSARPGPLGVDLSFVPALLKLAIPISLQHLLMTSLNLADTLMIGQLGEVQIGAIALGNQIFFLLALFLFGVGSGSAVFSSQFWGSRDISGVRRAMGLSLSLGCGGALFFTVAGVVIPRQLLSLFTPDQAVIHEGARYLRIVAMSYLFTAITMGYAHALRSVGDSRLPLLATAVSICLNILGNYLLIFGVGFFPALGVRGAAIATAVSRVLELAVILVVVYRRKGPVAASPRELFRFDRIFARRFFGRAAPVIFNEIFWSIGFTLYTVVFARMGTGHLAAYTISDTVGRLMLVFFIGSANATAILIGNRIGEGAHQGRLGYSSIDENPAQQIGLALLKILPLVSALVGVVVFFGVAPLVPRFFSVTPEVRTMVTNLMRAFALVMVAKVLNLHLIVGILRGGGDTSFALGVDVGFLWLVGVPAAFISGLFLGLPAHLVYLCIGLEEIGKLIMGINRVRSGRWINVLTDPEEALLHPVPDPSDATGYPL
ncbi:putative efflux protein, MATE family [Alkalispirochaeta americana]|uniref:Putative efflux protein, MATE family n=1 Tax=Alkalispirochaeta americana TaxID=159291 RepID=A0A1N6N5C8_9SPIO|nr:MATE family efflux transporter [Alkalispirochaeta americana]SIP87231.1 putative efflux protein, MATE family [Alkalispirochaeta americana]